MLCVCTGYSTVRYSSLFLYYDNVYSTSTTDTCFTDCSKSQLSKITDISCLTLCVMSSIQSLTNGSNHSENTLHFNSTLKQQQDDTCTYTNLHA